MKIASGSPVSNPWVGVLPAILLMAGFFAVPIVYTMGLSFSSDAHQGFTLDNYRTFFAEDRLFDALLRTLILGLSVVATSSLIAFPIAYYLAFVVTPAWRAVCLFVLVAPFWTSFTIRAFSWQLVLSDTLCWSSRARPLPPKWGRPAWHLLEGPQVRPSCLPHLPVACSGYRHQAGSSGRWRPRASSIPRAT